MTIFYRDSIGTVSAKVDKYGIQILDGIAYFSIGEKAEKRIPIENVLEIMPD